ncbi:hypothetical protein [Actinophytocola sp.]|uniref:hypothetical protein n=1 Tax=Actinophytocola sp. TaxID=1872138 RepID=UPI00389AB851
MALEEIIEVTGLPASRLWRPAAVGGAAIALTGDDRYDTGVAAAEAALIRQLRIGLIARDHADEVLARIRNGDRSVFGFDHMPLPVHVDQVTGEITEFRINLIGQVELRGTTPTGEPLVILADPQTHWHPDSTAFTPPPDRDLHLVYNGAELLVPRRRTSPHHATAATATTPAKPGPPSGGDSAAADGTAANGTVTVEAGDDGLFPVSDFDRTPPRPLDPDTQVSLVSQQRTADMRLLSPQELEHRWRVLISHARVLGREVVRTGAISGSHFDEDGNIAVQAGIDPRSAITQLEDAIIELVGGPIEVGQYDARIAQAHQDGTLPSIAECLTGEPLTPPDGSDPNALVRWVLTSHRPWPFHYQEKYEVWNSLIMAVSGAGFTEIESTTGTVEVDHDRALISIPKFWTSLSNPAAADAVLAMATAVAHAHTTRHEHIRTGARDHGTAQTPDAGLWQQRWTILLRQATHHGLVIPPSTSDDAGRVDDPATEQTADLAGNLADGQTITIADSDSEARNTQGQTWRLDTALPLRDRVIWLSRRLAADPPPVPLIEPDERREAQASRVAELDANQPHLPFLTDLPVANLPTTGRDTSPDAIHSAGLGDHQASVEHPAGPIPPDDPTADQAQTDVDTPASSIDDPVVARPTEPQTTAGTDASAGPADHTETDHTRTGHGDTASPGKQDVANSPSQTSLFDLDLTTTTQARNRPASATTDSPSTPDAATGLAPASGSVLEVPRERGLEVFEAAVAEAGRALAETAAAGGHKPTAWVRFSEMTRTDPRTGIDYSATQPEWEPVSQWWIQQATAALADLGYRVDIRRNEGRGRYRDHQIEVDHTAKLVIADAALPAGTNAFNLVQQVADLRAEADAEAHGTAERRATEQPVTEEAATHEAATVDDGEPDIDELYPIEQYPRIDGLTGVAELFTTHHWTLVEQEAVEIGGLYSEHWRRHDVSAAIGVLPDGQVLGRLFIRHGPWESDAWHEIETDSAQFLRDLIKQAGLHGVARPARLPGLWRVEDFAFAADAATEHANARKDNPECRLVTRPADSVIGESRQDSSDDDGGGWLFVDNSTPVPLAPPLPQITLDSRTDVLKHVLGDRHSDTELRRRVQVVLSGRTNKGLSLVEAQRQLATAEPEIYRHALTAAAGRPHKRGEQFDLNRAQQALERLAEGDPTLPLNSIGQYIEITEPDPEAKSAPLVGPGPTHSVRGVVVEVTPEPGNRLRVIIERDVTSVTGAPRAVQNVPVDAVLSWLDPAQRPSAEELRAAREAMVPAIRERKQQLDLHTIATPASVHDTDVIDQTTSKTGHLPAEQPEPTELTAGSKATVPDLPSDAAPTDLDAPPSVTPAGADPTSDANTSQNRQPAPSAPQTTPHDTDTDGDQADSTADTVTADTTRNPIGDPATTMAEDMAAAALAWWDAGCSVVRIETDGSKRPYPHQWQRFQQQRATREQVATWFQNGHPGIGIVTGTVSRDLEMFEFEGRALDEGLYLKMRDRLTAMGHLRLWERVMGGYQEASPSGGMHVLYRVQGGVERNTKLAQREARDDELTDQEQQRLRDTGRRPPRVLIETRGEGGMVVVAPSHGPVHDSGQPWRTLTGFPSTIPTITAAERDLLHMAARDLDQIPAPPPIPEPAPRAAQESGRRRPGDDFNQRATWHQVLEPHGWVAVGGDRTRTYWRRPGKDRGLSAVTGGDRGDYLWVFSTSTTLPNDAALSKWRTYALLNHGGDFSAAARALSHAGYGDQVSRTPVGPRSSTDSQARRRSHAADASPTDHPPHEQDLDQPSTTTTTSTPDSVRPAGGTASPSVPDRDPRGPYVPQVLATVEPTGPGDADTIMSLSGVRSEVDLIYGLRDGHRSRRSGWQPVTLLVDRDGSGHHLHIAARSLVQVREATRRLWPVATAYGLGLDAALDPDTVAAAAGAGVIVHLPRLATLDRDTTAVVAALDGFRAHPDPLPGTTPIAGAVYHRHTNASEPTPPPERRTPATTAADTTARTRAGDRTGGHPSGDPGSDQMFSVIVDTVGRTLDLVDLRSMQTVTRLLTEPGNRERAMQDLWAGIPVTAARFPIPVFELLRDVLYGVTWREPVDPDRRARAEIAAGRGRPMATTIAAIAWELDQRSRGDDTLAAVLQQTDAAEIVTQLNAIADRMAVHGEFVVPSRPNLLMRQESLFDVDDMATVGSDTPDPGAVDVVSPAAGDVVPLASGEVLVTHAQGLAFPGLVDVWGPLATADDGQPAEGFQEVEVRFRRSVVDWMGVYLEARYGGNQIRYAWHGDVLAIYDGPEGAPDLPRLVPPDSDGRYLFRERWFGLTTAQTTAVQQHTDAFATLAGNDPVHESEAMARYLSHGERDPLYRDVQEVIRQRLDAAPDDVAPADGDVDVVDEPRTGASDPTGEQPDSTREPASVRHQPAASSPPHDAAAAQDLAEIDGAPDAPTTPPGPITHRHETSADETLAGETPATETAAIGAANDPEGDSIKDTVSDLVSDPASETVGDTVHQMGPGEVTGEVVSLPDGEMLVTLAYGPAFPGVLNEPLPLLTIDDEVPPDLFGQTRRPDVRVHFRRSVAEWIGIYFEAQYGGNQIRYEWRDDVLAIYDDPWDENPDEQPRRVYPDNEGRYLIHVPWLALTTTQTAALTQHADALAILAGNEPVQESEAIARYFADGPGRDHVYGAVQELIRERLDNPGRSVPDAGISGDGVVDGTRSGESELDVEHPTGTRNSASPRQQPHTTGATTDDRGRVRDTASETETSAQAGPTRDTAPEPIEPQPPPHGPRAGRPDTSFEPTAVADHELAAQTSPVTSPPPSPSPSMPRSSPAAPSLPVVEILRNRLSASKVGWPSKLGAFLRATDPFVAQDVLREIARATDNDPHIQVLVAMAWRAHHGQATEAEVTTFADRLIEDDPSMVGHAVGRTIRDPHTRQVRTVHAIRADIDGRLFLHGRLADSPTTTLTTLVDPDAWLNPIGHEILPAVEAFPLLQRWNQLCELAATYGYTVHFQPDTSVVRHDDQRIVLGSDPLPELVNQLTGLTEQIVALHGPTPTTAAVSTTATGALSGSVAPAAPPTGEVQAPAVRTPRSASASEPAPRSLGRSPRPDGIDRITLVPADDPSTEPLADQLAIGRHSALRFDEPARLALTYVHQILRGPAEDATFLAQTVINVGQHGEAEQVAIRLIKIADKIDGAGFATPVTGEPAVLLTTRLRAIAQHVLARLTPAGTTLPAPGTAPAAGTAATVDHRAPAGQDHVGEPSPASAATPSADSPSHERAATQPDSTSHDVAHSRNRRGGTPVTPDGEDREALTDRKPREQTVRDGVPGAEPVTGRERDRPASSDHVLTEPPIANGSPATAAPARLDSAPGSMPTASPTSDISWPTDDPDRPRTRRSAGDPPQDPAREPLLGQPADRIPAPVVPAPVRSSTTPNRHDSTVNGSVNGAVPMGSDQDSTTKQWVQLVDHASHAGYAVVTAYDAPSAVDETNRVIRIDGNQEPLVRVVDLAHKIGLIDATVTTTGGDATDPEATHRHTPASAHPPGRRRVAAVTAAQPSPPLPPSMNPVFDELVRELGWAPDPPNSQQQRAVAFRPAEPQPEPSPTPVFDQLMHELGWHHHTTNTHNPAITAVVNPDNQPPIPTHNGTANTTFNGTPNGRPDGNRPSATPARPRAHDEPAVTAGLTQGHRPHIAGGWGLETAGTTRGRK